MTARRKTSKRVFSYGNEPRRKDRRVFSKSTGLLKNPGYKKPVGKPPPCPQALCARCGHKRNWHMRYKVLGRCTPPFKGARSHRACTCDEFVLAKPAKKRKVDAPLPIRWTEGGEPVLTKRAKPPERPPRTGPMPLTRTEARVLRERDEEAPDLLSESWLDVPCRFSANGAQGCFISEINRHGGPCVPCWARALLRIREQGAEIAKLKRGKP